MTSGHWTIVDHDTAHVEDGWSKRGQGWSVSSHFLRGGLRDGVQRVTLQNGDLSLDVLPTRGLGIHAARVGATRFGWNSPVAGPVHPMYVPISEPSGLGWLDGFDELLVRCGLESNGAPEFDDDGRLRYPLHGKIANRPAYRVDVEFTDQGVLRLKGEVDESRFHFSKLRLASQLDLLPDEPTLVLEETITNRSAAPSTAQMLYHINFGPPLLETGSRLFVPAEQVVPRTDDALQELSAWNKYGQAKPAVPERVYFIKPRANDQGRAHALLVNAQQTLGAHIEFDTSTLPYFTLWKNPVAEEDGTVTGLEPGTNFPNPRTFETEQGRVVPLAPGASVTFRLRLTLLADRALVAARQALVESQLGEPPQLLEEAPEGWVAD